MATQTSAFFLLTCLIFIVTPTLAEIEGLYCGLENCYEILGASRDSSRGEITKVYRQLARTWHPDRHKKKEDKEKASHMFQKIANAYEILKDEESRKDYDYMLDNPEEYYSHYFYYYRRRMAPKVDPKIVIAVTITVISVIQYWGAWNNYNTAINYLVTVPKYRLQAQDIARKEGLLGEKRKKDRSKTKEELKEEEENVLKKVLGDKMDIRGGYCKPSIKNILWLQLLFSPYYTARYIIWYVHWVWTFSICKHEYGDEQKEYIIRKKMKLRQSQWDAIEDHDKESFMKQELWLSENFDEWKRQKEEDTKAELATNSRYKSYRRYMKKGGAGQMTFGPE